VRTSSCASPRSCPGPGCFEQSHGASRQNSDHTWSLRRHSEFERLNFGLGLLGAGTHIPSPRGGPNPSSHSRMPKSPGRSDFCFLGTAEAIGGGRLVSRVSSWRFGAPGFGMLAKSGLQTRDASCRLRSTGCARTHLSHPLVEGLMSAWERRSHGPVHEPQLGSGF